MIHENIKIDIDYEKLGIKHKGADAVFTTYIKEMYPDYQNVFERPLVIICRAVDMSIIHRVRVKLSH